jgi:ADP-ribosylglycohydrolase
VYLNDLTLTHETLLTERLQCEQEGREMSLLTEEFERLAQLDLDDPHNQALAQSLLDRSLTTPLRSDYAFVEPSDLESICALRPASPPALPKLTLSDTQLEERLHGGWVGRSIGCLLGKPVEGWDRERMHGFLKATGRFPLNDFFRYDIAPPQVREQFRLSPEGAFADRVSCMPEDDDLNYTVLNLAVLKKHGLSFTSSDIASFWLDTLPIQHTFTAERVAYRNLCNLIAPPQSACYRNPYREWIGAQIRADFWGYVAPGDPALASELAWRDASISHVKNGIYGAMWAAAMIAAAFVTDDIPTIIRAGLAQIPQTCRLTDMLEGVLEWKEVEVEYETAAYRVHEFWNEHRSYDWCHVISNAMVVAIGLLWGEGDYAKTICRAVQCCFDTDCNGATCGSVLGVMLGRRALPSRWTDLIQDTLQTGVTGYHRVSLSDLARESLALANRTREERR